MAPGPDLLFGRLAVLNGFLSPEQLQGLLRRQEDAARAGEPAVTLGELCQMTRLMTPEQVQRILSAQAFLEMQKEDKRIGSLAVKNGFVTEEDVRFALEAQKQSFQAEMRPPKPLGEILVEADLLTRQQLDALLKRQEQLQRDTPSGEPERAGEPPGGPARPERTAEGAGRKVEPSDEPSPEDKGGVTGRLLQILGEGSGQSFLIRSKVVIGRHPANEVPIPDAGSSRQHARIEFRSAARRHLLIDLNSQNGTFLNDEAVAEPTPLNPGDLIQIGETVFQYESGENVQPGFIPAGGTMMMPRTRLEELRKKSASARPTAADPARSESLPCGPDRPERDSAIRRGGPAAAPPPPPPVRRGILIAGIAPAAPPPDAGPESKLKAPAPPAVPAASDRGAIPSILKQLADLHAAGALTDEEYRRKKQELLSRL